VKLRTAKRIYDAINAKNFGGVLHRPRFLNTHSRSTYAAYEWTDRYSMIHVNLKTLRWYNAYSIIFHEMIHQYLEEFLGIDEGTHHGFRFWQESKKFASTNFILFEEL